MILPGALAVGAGLIGMSQAFTPGGKWQYYQIDRNGNVVRVTQTVEGGNRSSQVTDVGGQPLPGYEGFDLNDPAYADLFLRFNVAMVDERFVPWPLTVEFLEDSYRAAEPGTIPLRSVAPPGMRLNSVALYDVPRGLIDLYDPVTHMPIGSVGPGGFAPNGSPPGERFQGKPLNRFSQGGRHVLAFDSIVYWIELDKRRVRPLFHAKGNDPVFSAVEIGPPATPTVVLATRRSIHVLRPGGEEIFSAPLEFSSDDYFFQPALLPGNSHLILQAMPTPGRQDLRRVVMEYSTEGKLLRRTEPPRLADFRGPKLAETAMFGGIFPLALRPLLPTWILDEVLDVRSTQFPRVFEGTMIASALCCAVLAILLARRCGVHAAKTVGWAATGLLLGPAGLVVLLGIHEWPAREVCAACGRKRISARATCGRCAAASPPAPFDGREIFEPAGVLQSAGY
jgi:hypothetical protein